MPENWGEVTMVNGPVLDGCNGLGEEVVHWLKASRMHEAAMEHAFDNHPDVNVIAVLEEDTQGDGAVAWTQDKWWAFDAAFKREEWKLLRMSYRPYDFEPDKDNAGLGKPEVACPNECRCQTYDTTLCFAHSAGCALQASDAYMMHRRAYDQTTEMLRRGKVVDYHVFRAIEGQWLLRPALSYQSRYSYAPDSISIDDSKAVNQLYMDKCAYTADADW